MNSRAATVSVNGTDRPIAGALTVAELVAELVDGGEGVAVALNGDVVSRSDWALTSVVEGDRLEVVSATQGG